MEETWNSVENNNSRETWTSASDGKVVDDQSYLSEAWEDGSNAFMYNANKLGAGMASGVANIGEAIGVDMNTSRDVQNFYQENAKRYDTGDEFIQEAYNPLNYTVGGKGYGLLSSILGSSYANQAVDSATTGEDFNLGKANNQASIGAGITSAIPLVGQGVNAVKNAIVKSGGKSSDEIAQLQRLADKHGIELTPASVTGSPSLARTEHNLGDSATAGLGLRQAVGSEREGIEGAINSQFNKMGANGSNVNAGEMFSQGTKELVANEKQYFNDVFEKLFAKYGDSKIFSIRGVKQEAKDLLAQAERNPIIKNQTAYRDAKALANTDDFLTWEDWSKLRTTLGGLTQDTMATGKASTGAYKRMYSFLEGDLQSSATAIGDKTTLDGYNKAVALYKQFKLGLDGKDSGARFMNSVVRDKINPESIGHSINNSTLKAGNALEAGGFEVATGVPMAKKVSATDTLMSSQRVNDEGISLAKFLKYSDKDGFRKVAEAPNRRTKTLDLLGDDVVPTRQGVAIKGKVSDMDIIDDLREIANSVVVKDSYKNNSKTAVYNQLNWMKANPLSAITMFAKDAVLSASYRSDTFKKWLSKGYISQAQYQSAKNLIDNPNTKNTVKATNVLFGSDND